MTVVSLDPPEQLRTTSRGGVSTAQRLGGGPRSMGDVEHLPETGNILATYGALLPPDELEGLAWEDMFNTRGWTRVREYARTEPAELLWEVVIDEPSSEVGWTAFEGERVKSLMP